MPATPNRFLLWLRDLILLLLAMALGLRTRDPLVSAGVLAGFVMLAGSARRLDPKRYGIALPMVLGGSALLASLALWSRFGGGWLWTFPFLWAGYRAAVLGLTRGQTLRRNAPPILALLTLGLYALAFLGPWLLHPATEGGISLRIFDLQAGLHGVKAILTIKSWWVMLHFSLLLLISLIMKKSRWGFAYVGSLFLLAVITVTAWLPSLEATLVAIFSASPVSLCEQFLAFSLERFGAAGPGVMLLAAFAALILWPLYVESLNLRQAAQEAGILRAAMQTAAAHQLAQVVRGVTPVSLLAWFTQRGTLTLLVGSLWMALARFHAAGKILPHQRLADLAMPQGHFLWNPWNVLAAGLLGSVHFFLMALKKAHGQYDPRLKQSWLIVLGSLACGLFVPSGVTLFLLCFTTAWLLGLTLIFESYSHPADQSVKPNPPVAPYVPIPQPVDAPLRPNIQQPLPEPEPESQGEAIFRLGAPLVSLAQGQEGSVYSLDDRGRVFHGEKELPFLKTLDPLACVAAGAANLLVIDRNGTIRISPLQDGIPQPPQDHTAATAICGHTVNPFGTILALSGPRSCEIRGLWLASKKEQVLAQCIGDPMALGFSMDNRRLAVGDAEGRIHLLDMATRVWGSSLDASVAGDASPVEQILSLSDGGWLVRYRHAVAIWDGEGRLRHAVQPNGRVSVIAVHTASGRIAFGYEEGLVSTTTPEMKITKVHGRIHQGRVTALAFGLAGRTLLSAGTDGSVHRIEL
jgi:hypothetical protein